MRGSQAATRRILITTDAVGGVWRYTVELCRGLSERGWRVAVAVIGPHPSGQQQLELAHVAHLIMTDLSLDWLAPRPEEYNRAGLLLSGLTAMHGDVALLHAPALLGRAVWPAPVAVMVHSCLTTWFATVRGGPVPADYAWRAAAAANGLRRADRVAAPTRAFAAAVREAYGLGVVTAIHNGRRPLALPDVPREPSVLTAGRLWDDGKNVALLDRVAAELDAPVWAAGSRVGPEGWTVQLDHIRHLGALDEVGMAHAFASACVFASAAFYEPFGLAVLEAAQAGLALVLSDIPTFRELWDGAASFVAPDDEAGWAAALRQALADPQPLADRARQRANQYTADAMVDASAAWLAAAVA